MASLRSRRSVLPVLVAVIIGAGAAGAVTGLSGVGDTGGFESPPVAVAKADLELTDGVVDLVNKQRVQNGCDPLTVDPRLVRAAQAHSEDMAARDYLDHTTPEGLTFRDRIRNAGFANPSTGENLARGPRDAADVVDRWMASPSHRLNIVNCDFSVTGVGLNENGMYWTQEFGRI